MINRVVRVRLPVRDLLAVEQGLAIKLLSFECNFLVPVIVRYFNSRVDLLLVGILVRLLDLRISVLHLAQQVWLYVGFHLGLFPLENLPLHRSDGVVFRVTTLRALVGLVEPGELW